MKPILLIVCLLPLLAGAQDCKLLRESDPYTKEMKLSSGFINLQAASVTIDADSKEIDFFFVVNDRCFNDASTVFIFFEGSKAKTTNRNTGSMNCDGNFHFTFRNGASTPTVLQKLSTQKVAQFIFTGNDKKQIVVGLLPDQQKIFMEAVACVVKEGKILVK
jgi:hypothetical protein